MCDLCVVNKQDPEFINGNKFSDARVCTLFRVTSGNLTYIRLCFFHQVELHVLGERRFLRKNLEFAKSLAGKAASSISRSSFF